MFVFCLFSFSALCGMDEQLSDIFFSFSLEKNLSVEQIKVDMGCLAAKNGDLESLKHFVDSSNVDSVNTQGLSVLQAALDFAFKSKEESQYTPLLEYLFAQDAEIQGPIKGTEISALGFATSIAWLENYIRPLEILLAKGGNPFIPCTRDKTTSMSLCVAARHKQHLTGADSVLQLFRQHATTLAEAVACWDNAKVKQFANQTAIDALAKNGNNVLVQNYKLYDYGIEEALTSFEILLKQGAKPSEELKDHPLPGYTFMLLATQHALEKGDTKLIEACLNNGGNPKHQAFPMAPSAVDFIKTVSRKEPTNPHISKIRALFNTYAN